MAKKTEWWRYAIALLLVAAVSCVGVFGVVGAVLAAPPGVETFTIRFPRLYSMYRYVEATDEWELTIWGYSNNYLGQLMGQDLSMLNIPDSTMKILMAADIQHVELVTHNEGMFVYINGKCLPYIRWDAQSLALAGKSTVALGAPEVMSRITPLLQRIGLDLVIQLPSAIGTESIPYRPAGDLKLSKASPEFDDLEGEITLPFEMDSNGNVAMAGIWSTDVNAIFRWLALPLEIGRVHPMYVSMISQLGDQLGIETRGNGLFFTIDGQDLPSIAWGPDQFTGITYLFGQFQGSQSLSVVADTLAKFAETKVNLTIQLP